MTEEQMKERKKMLCDLMDNDLYVPMKIKELAILLDIPKEKRSDLQEVLDQLMLEGKVEVSQKGKYSKGKGKLLAGVFTAHAKGFGFVTVEGMDEDLFIGEDNTHGAHASGHGAGNGEAGHQRKAPGGRGDKNSVPRHSEAGGNLSGEQELRFCDS